MKILFWVPYPTEGASNRYRVEQYLPFLRKAGIICVLRPFWSSAGYSVLYKHGYFLKKLYYFIAGTVSRLIDLMSIWHYDLVFIHREAYPIGGPYLEKVLTILKKPIIFDFDDAIFLPSSSGRNKFIEYLKRPSRTKDIIKYSRYVIAGNDYLADFALKFNKNVAVIPTSIDTAKYAPKAKNQHNGTVIGWIGSTTTADFINIMHDVMIRLSGKHNSVVLKVVGGDFHVSGLSNIMSKPWSLEKEIEDLETFDIGIMPMADNEWTRGKCGFKAILYMSMGLPCVCSPVGVNKEIVKDGVNGFLADREDEWADKLSRLIEDAELRNRMGLIGRKTAEERYSVEVNAPKILGIIRRVCNERYGG